MQANGPKLESGDRVAIDPPDDDFTGDGTVKYHEEIGGARLYVVDVDGDGAGYKRFRPWDLTPIG